MAARRVPWLFGGVVALAVAALVWALVSSPGGGQPSPPLNVTPGLAPPRPAPHTIEYGASVNRLFNDRLYSPTQIAAQLQALAATGATVARSDALWEASELTPPSDGRHHFDWQWDDTIAGDLAAAHLKWLPVIDYSAGWAQSVAGQDHSPPASDADYAAYAQAFAFRYGANGTFWHSHPELPAEPVDAFEIWNEPDDDANWYPSASPAGYARMYALTRRAIDRVDPSARVLIGGLENAQSFLPAMVAAMPSLAGHIDGVAIHPYGTPSQVMLRVRNGRNALRRLGMQSVPLYVTEFGWTVSPPTSPGYASPAQRVADLRVTIPRLGHSDCGLASVLVYTWVTPELNLDDDQDWYGIAPVGQPGDVTAQDAQAVAAFTDGLRSAQAPGPVQPFCR